MEHSLFTKLKPLLKQARIAFAKLSTARSLSDISTLELQRLINNYFAALNAIEGAIIEFYDEVEGEEETFKLLEEYKEFEDSIRELFLYSKTLIEIDPERSIYRPAKNLEFRDLLFTNMGFKIADIESKMDTNENTFERSLIKSIL